MRTTKQKGTSPAKYPDYSWINDDPIEIDYNADGSEFIPIFYIEQKLTKLDPFWGTENFKFQLLKSASGLMFADGSLELVVTYGGRTRKLVGSTTMLIPADTDFNDPLVNSNFAGTIKSIATSNACKPIGANFGQLLNDRGAITSPTQKTQKNGKQKPPAVKMKPDEKIQSQYNKAYEQKNGLVIVLENIYDIKYTGEKENA